MALHEGTATIIFSLSRACFAVSRPARKIFCGVVVDEKVAAAMVEVSILVERVIAIVAAAVGVRVAAGVAVVVVVVVDVRVVVVVARVVA